MVRASLTAWAEDPGPEHLPSPPLPPGDGAEQPPPVADTGETGPSSPSKTSASIKQLTWRFPVCVKLWVVFVLVVGLGALDWVVEPWWPPWGEDLQLVDGASSSGSWHGHSGLEMAPGKDEGSAAAAGSFHRRTDLDASVDGYYAEGGWGRVAFNFRQFDKFWDPTKPCGRSWSSLLEDSSADGAETIWAKFEAVLSCDGETLMTNILAHAVAFGVLALLCVLCCFPQRCCGFFFVFFIGEALNIWHEFVAAGRFEDPSNIDLWLSTLGLIAGCFLGVLVSCVLRCTCCRGGKLMGEAETDQHLVVETGGWVVHPVGYKMTEKQKQEVRLRAIFTRYDLDGSGSLDDMEVHRLTKLLFQREIGLSDGAIARLVRNADRDGDGKVDCEEFVMLVTDAIEQVCPPPPPPPPP
eukprot:SAG11_NODE_206_length_12389_cov_11.831192_1_plen_409_part_10